MNAGRYAGMTREQFIVEHLRTCEASRARKYGEGARGRYHTLEYSRRKCAANLWRQTSRYRSAAGRVE